MFNDKVLEHAPKALAKEKKKPTPLKAVYPEEINKDLELAAHARYLYWACFRGHLYIIRHILDDENYAISPFAPIYEGRSALMASIIGKSLFA